jgi:hypothetical protein
MTGKFNNFNIISVYAPTKEKNKLVKDPSDDKLKQTHQGIPVYDTKILVGNCNAKIGRQEIFKPVTQKWSLHETTNENGISATGFDDDDNNNNNKYFPHRNIHKETQQSPDGRTNNQTDHVLVHGRHAYSMMNARRCRGADCDMHHHLARITYG